MSKWINDTPGLLGRNQQQPHDLLEETKPYAVSRAPHLFQRDRVRVTIQFTGVETQEKSINCTLKISVVSCISSEFLACDYSFPATVTCWPLTPGWNLWQTQRQENLEEEYPPAQLTPPILLMSKPACHQCISTYSYLEGVNIWLCSAYEWTET